MVLLKQRDFFIIVSKMFYSLQNAGKKISVINEAIKLPNRNRIVRYSELENLISTD